VKKATVLIAFMAAFVAMVTVGTGNDGHATKVAAQEGPGILSIKVI
jgi:hypothetical protein